MAKTSRNSKNLSKEGGSLRVTKSLAKKFLARVPEQNVFWCNDGHVFHDINELKEALPGMSDHTFSYHSNWAKKDFSNWIRDVIGDNKLAESLESAPDRELAAKIIQERCSQLISKAG